MSADDETNARVLKEAKPSKSKNSEGWTITDVSLGSSDRIVISGCKHATGQTFLSIFLIIPSDPQSDAKYLYSREFSKNCNPELCRLVSFVDELNLITCYDNLVEKVSIVNDEVVQSSKLPNDAASCLCINEKQTFIGFRKSCDVIVLDSDLNKVRLISLKGLQDGWPMDLVVVKDSLLLCTAGFVPRRALSFTEKDGQLLREFTNPRSDKSVPLSLTVSVEADLVAVLWNSPPQLTIHSFSHGHCLVVAGVEPAERIRSVGQDKLVMVDEKGEMKFFYYEEFFTFENLEAILSSLLTPHDCKELMDFFGVSHDQIVREYDKRVDSEEDFDEVNLRDLLQYFEDEGIIHSRDVTEIIEAFTHLGKEKAFLSPLEAYQKYSGLTRSTDNTSNSSLSAGRTAGETKTFDSQDVEGEKKKSAENESTSEVDEDEDAASWTSDDEPLSSFIADESQKDRISEQVVSEERDCQSSKCNLDDPSVSGIRVHSTSDTSLFTGQRMSLENNEGEVESEEMDTSDEDDMTMEEEHSDLKVNNDMTIEETINVMMDEIQALKHQNCLILSYLKTQPSKFPGLNQHSSTNQFSLNPPSSLCTQTLPNGQPTHQAGAPQPTQVKTLNHKEPLPIQQLQAMVHQSQALQQAGPNLPTPSGEQQQCTQTTQATTIAQPDQTSDQTPVAYPPQMLPPGQQCQPPQSQQSTLQQSQTSEPPQLSHPLPSIPQPQSSSSPSPAQPPPPLQPSHSVSSSQLTQSQPSSHTSQIAQPYQILQQTQASNGIPPTQLPPPVNVQTSQRVPLNPYPQVSPNHYGNLPVRFSPHPLMYFPVHPNIARPPFPTCHSTPVNYTMLGKSGAQLSSGSLAQIPAHSQSHRSAVTTIVPSIQPAQLNSTLMSQTPGQTLSHVPQSPGALATVVTSAVCSTQSSASASNLSSVISHNVAVPWDPTALGGYGFEALPQKVKLDILPHKDCMQVIIHRNAIVRILADYFFSDQERLECNCNGKNGYKPFKSEKLERIRYVMVELLRNRPIGYPQLDENLEWRRLCKVIDSHNRGHRTRIRAQLKESSSRGDLADP
ncbi:hypothetical protein HOLleu_21146 [Holothuria leucospilota]|uniref:Uncharacterized protein n=1 Tax=Holothuria leucospilota TaxID=206669 RepID=A0A9Q1BWW9_HOLLE|nr:hypothetical protein HOLleu_21146 [Holothuria leucospilota]